MSDDLRIKITTDIKDAEKNFDKVTKSMSKLAYQNGLTESEIKETARALRGMSKAFKDVKVEFDDSSIDGYVDGYKDLRDTMKKLSKEGSITASEFEKLQSSLKDLKAILKGTYDPSKKLEKALKDSGDVASEISKSLKTTDKAISKTGTTTKKTSSEMAKFTKHMNKNAGAMRRLGTDANRTAGELHGLSKAISSIGFGKLTAIYGLSNVFAKALQGASDMVETINLFNVSMGEFAVETGNYFNRISQSAGLDPTFLQQATANYSLLARSMGFTNSNANILGKSVTNLGVDLSSLMNIPLEQVMDDLRSGLLGQTETVYKYGIDLTEASLKQEAMRLGIEKSVSTMSQAEKMYLRYSVMIRASALAHGDFAKTIETPANQLRILSQQVVQLSRTIGTVFVNALGGVLPYINGFVMALRVLIETIAGLLGWEMPKFENMSNGLGAVTSSSVDLGDSIDKNTGSAKKLKKALKDLTLGFDELNIIPEQTEPKPTGGGGGGGVIGGGELPLPDLTAYSAQLENVRMKATAIRDRILEWLGFTKEIDPETGKITWKLKDGYTRLELILDIVKAVGLAFLTWKIAAILPTLLAIGKALLSIAKGALTAAKLLLFGNVKGAIAALLGPLTAVSTKLLTIAGIAGTMFGIAATLVFMVHRIVDLYQNNEQFQKGVARLKEIWDIVWEGLKAFGEWFMNTFVSPAVEGLKKIGEYFLNMLPESVREPVKNFFTTVSELISQLGLDFTDLLTILGGIGLLFTPAAPFGVALLVFELITVLIRGLGSLSEEQWQKVKESVKNALENIGKFFKNLWEDLKVILEPFWQILKDILGTLWDLAAYVGGKLVDAFKAGWELIKEYVVEPFKTNWENVVELFKKIGDNIADIWELMKTKLKAGWDYLHENVLKVFIEKVLPKLKEVFELTIKILIEAWELLSSVIKTMWNTVIKPVFDKFCKVIKDWWENWVKPNLEAAKKLFTDLFESACDVLGGLIDFIVGVFTGDWEKAWTGVQNIFIGIWNGLVSIVETGINVMINLINWFIKKINKIKLPDWLGGFGFDISEIERVELPKLELAVANIENKVDQANNSNKGEKAMGRSAMMSGDTNLVPNFSNYNRTIPQIPQSQFVTRQNDYIQNQNQTPQETIINNVLTLDGEVIYQNQQRVRNQKGVDFGNPVFSR